MSALQLIHTYLNDDGELIFYAAFCLVVGNFLARFVDSNGQIHSVTYMQSEGRIRHMKTFSSMHKTPRISCALLFLSWHDTCPGKTFLLSTISGEYCLFTKTLDPSIFSAEWARMNSLVIPEICQNVSWMFTKNAQTSPQRNEMLLV